MGGKTPQKASADLHKEKASEAEAGTPHRSTAVLTDAKMKDNWRARNLEERDLRQALHLCTREGEQAGSASWGEEAGSVCSGEKAGSASWGEKACSVSLGEEAGNASSGDAQEEIGGRGHEAEGQEGEETCEVSGEHFALTGDTERSRKPLYNSEFITRLHGCQREL